MVPNNAPHGPSYILFLVQEKEFAWLLENEYKQKMEVIDKSIDVGLRLD